jgi:hypothetical protein
MDISFMNTLQKLSIASSGAVLITLKAASPIQAVTLASAALGPTGQNIGTFIAPFQFHGWRFNLDRPFQVTEIGGHLSSVTVFPGDPVEPIFSAIIRLDYPDSLPKGNPFLSEEVIASTTFIPNELSSDLRVPLSATLNPGTYGLVFGSGLFGATGSALMPLNNPSFPDSTYFTYFSIGVWDNDLFISNARFVVEGNPITKTVPESSSRLGLVTFAFLGIGLTLNRKLKQRFKKQKTKATLILKAIDARRESMIK